MSLTIAVKQCSRKSRTARFEKVDVRKRPGTVAICAAIMNHYKVDAVPHLICGGFSKNETEDALIDLNFLGVDNVLIIRGDAPRNEAFFEPEPGGHRYAIDLMKQVANMNNGIYLEEDLKGAVKTKFCIGIAGYPEKHFEAPNMNTDLHFLKAKVDAGAEYIITQMFFDNQKYFDFVKRCRDIGITIPIIPGFKPITTKKQLTVIPRTFYVDIPSELANEIIKCKIDDEVAQVGTEWLTQQSKELKKFGVPVLALLHLRQTDCNRQRGSSISLKGSKVPRSSNVRSILVSNFGTFETLELYFTPHASISGKRVLFPG